jgi:hypothetical protein
MRIMLRVRTRERTARYHPYRDSAHHQARLREEQYGDLDAQLFPRITRIVIVSHEDEDEDEDEDASRSTDNKGMSDDSIAALTRTTQIELLTTCDRCPVCLDDFKDDEGTHPCIVLGCEHGYHERCIVPWLKRVGNCPVCRASVK